MCSHNCNMALPPYRPKPGDGCTFIGTIPINLAAAQSIRKKLTTDGTGTVDDSDKNAEEFARLAICLLLDPNDLKGHNVGGSNKMQPVCPTKVRNLVVELRRRFASSMSRTVESARAPGVPHSIAVALNQFFRQSRSNDGKSLFSPFCVFHLISVLLRFEARGTVVGHFELFLGENSGFMFYG